MGLAVKSRGRPGGGGTVLCLHGGSASMTACICQNPVLNIKQDKFYCTQIIPSFNCKMIQGHNYIFFSV